MRTLDLDHFWPNLNLTLPETGRRPAANQASLETYRFVAPANTPKAAAIAAKDFAIDPIRPYQPRALQPKTVRRAALPATAKTAVPEVNPRAFRVEIRNPSALWTFAGFAAGMLVWQVASIWDAPHDAVPSRPMAVARTAAPTQAPATRRAMPSPLTTGSIERTTHPIGQPSMQPNAQALYNLDPKSCLALMLDRTSGATHIEKCADDQSPMRDAGRQRRGDLAVLARNVDPKAWNRGTAIEAPQEPGVNTLQPGDFNLEISLPAKP
jgi:hypothetical protein